MGGFLTGTTLNDFLARPGPDRLSLRRTLSRMLSEVRYRDAVAPHLHAARLHHAHALCHR